MSEQERTLVAGQGLHDGGPLVNPREMVVSWLPHIFHDRDFNECMTACDKLLTVKGADYTQGESKTGDDEGRLKNFYRNARRLGMTPTQVLAIYMFKHIDAVETFLLHGQVESEAIEGRIQDAINYMLLLYKMVKFEKRKHQLELKTVAK